MRYLKVKTPEVTNRLTAIRKSAGMTQQELATKAGVTRQTIISIEKGKYTPSLTLALTLAQLFKCKIEDIFSL